MADGTERKRESPTRWSNGRNASLALTSVHGDRFGPVTKMIGLASSLNKVDGPNWPSLEQLMRIGLIKRGNPVYDSSGDLTGPSGYLTGPSGNLTGPSGDLTGPSGNLTGPSDNLNGPTGVLW